MEYTRSSESSNLQPRAFMIQSACGFASEDYYRLLEFRLAVADDVDLFDGGLLIFHVDDSQHLQCIGCYGNATTHVKVSLLPADGNY